MSHLMRAYRNENDFDFPKWSRRLLVVSIVLMVISIASIATRGLSLSIDFEGGSSWAIPSQDFSRSEAEAVLAEFDQASGARFQEATTPEGARILRVSGQVDNVALGSEVADALAKAADLETGDVTVTTIGPSWGADITRQAVQSLVWFLVLIAGYLAWRLEPKMAVSALASVVHDLLLTVGMYSILQIEVSPATVIAFLTILGYSLYDTVVVFDRMQDGVRRYSKNGQYTYTMIMRRTLNQSMMRCINTSVTTLLPILSMLLVGGVLLDQPLLSDFSLALVVGLALGVYSSMFVASPIEVILKEREKRFVEIRERLISKGVDITDTRWKTHSTEAVGPVPQRAAAATGASEAPPLTVNVGGHPPRPRKKRR